MNATVSYAYAVARDADGSLEEALSGLPGVAEATVHLVRVEHSDDVVVAVSPVPERDFQEAALRAHLEDLDWLESVARAHHRVIEALAARTAVLPLRLATVYLDDERVRLMLRARREAFADRLTDLAAQVEWGVKIYVEAAAEAEGPAGPPTDAGLTPGGLTSAGAEHSETPAKTSTGTQNRPPSGSRPPPALMRSIASSTGRSRANSPAGRERTSSTTLTLCRCDKLKTSAPMSCRPQKDYPGYASKSPGRGPRTPSPPSPKPNR